MGERIGYRWARGHRAPLPRSRPTSSKSGRMQGRSQLQTRSEKLGFGYAWIVISPLALNAIKLRIGGDDAGQPDRLGGIDLLLARFGFVGPRTDCSTLCGRINRIADYVPRQLRWYL